MREPSPTGLRVQALLLADHIYLDQETGKHVIAGTFHQLNVVAVPTTFSRPIGLFLSLVGLSRPTSIDLEFVTEPSDEVLMGLQSLDLPADDPDLPVTVAIEVPPLPLPRAGRYRFQIVANGQVVGTTTLVVVIAPGREAR